jgi:Domain of unknown function (DUF4337)
MSHGHGAGHGAESGEKKWVAIVISLLALCLALAETLAKSAQTNTISSTVEASNLWAFYQAKTIRQTTLKTAYEEMEVTAALTSEPATKQALQKRIADWKAEVERYQTEPKADGKGEGRRELMQRAIAEGKKRDVSGERYHHYELSSAAFQIGIVLASVFLLTNMMLMIAGAGVASVIGIAFFIIGMFFPSAVHLF